MSNNFNNPNPYEASGSMPGQIPLGAGQIPKPQSMVVFGILNLIFGGLGVLGLVVGIIGLLMPQPAGANPMQDMMNTPTLKAVTIASQVASAGLIVIELASGVGLLNGKGWGRKWAMRYAIGTIVLVVVVSVVNIMLISFPLFAKAAEMPDGPEKAGMIGGGAALFATPCCGLIYPILLLIFMMRDSVKNYLQSVGEPV